MKTRKLLLGFCLLAAVTGSTPQVFGMFAQYVRPLVLKGKGATLSDDPARQARYENLLKATEERVDAECKILKEMRFEEVDCVDKAIDLEHRAYFVRGLAARELEAVCRVTAPMQQQLTIAEEAATRAVFRSTKMEANAKVRTLRLKFAQAFANKKRVLQKCKDYNDEADTAIEEAQKCRKRARDLRDQRIEYLAKAVSTHIADRGGEGKQALDLRKLDEPNCDIEQQEAIRVRFLQDFIIINATYYVHAEGRIAGFIEDYIRSHTDKRWRGNVGDNDSKLCEKLQEKYHPIKPDYNYRDLTQFERQREQLVTVFGGENDLLEYARFYYDNGLSVLRKIYGRHFPDA
jgi:hypothetical protein